MSDPGNHAERIVADWQEQSDRGIAPSAEDVIRAHSELAEELRLRFRTLALLGQAFAPAPGPDLALRPLAAGRYTGFRRVAQGGMGIVFSALDTDLGREVAFKMVRGAPAPADGESPRPEQVSPPAPGTPGEAGYWARAERFLDEARITAGLSHPGIVPVHELGRTPEGVPYYTMRFVPGDRTLAHAIEEASRRPFESRLALLEPFLRVCDTIEYAHSHGVLHRDLKPDNVALGEFGEVVVLDWGAAKVVGAPDRTGAHWRERTEAARATGAAATLSQALGTPGYMSPEAARGALAELSEASDVYSLGAVLFEILAGRPPFVDGGGASVLEQVLSRTPPSARDIDPAVPEELALLCARCLAHVPSERPQRAADLSAAVRAWQAHAATSREVAELLRAGATAIAMSERHRGAERLAALDEAAVPLRAALRMRPDDPEASRLSTLAKRLRDEAVRERIRRGRRRILGAATALLLVAGVVTAVVVDRLLRDERDLAVESGRRAQRAEAASTAQLREALVARAHERRASRTAGARATALDALVRAAAIQHGPDLAEEAAGALALPDLTLERTVETGEAQVVAFAATPDGSRLAWCEAGGRLVVRDQAGGAPDRVISPGLAGEPWTLRLDRTGRLLACRGSGDERLRLFDAATGALLWTDRDPGVGDAADFDPQGALLAVGRPDGRVDLVRLVDRGVVRSWQTGLSIHRLRFSRDGGCVAAVSESQSRVELRALAPPWTDRTLALASPAHCVAWAPDGNHLLVGCSDEDLRLLRLDPGAGPVEQVLLRGHRGLVTEVAFAAGGDFALSLGWDDTIRLWNPWVGVDRVVLTGTGGWLWVGADDHHAGCVGPAGRGIRLYTLEPGRICRHLPWDGGTMHGCTLSPDGGRLAVCGEGVVRVWDVATGGRIATVPGGGLWGVAFAPDGALLTTGMHGLRRFVPAPGPAPAEAAYVAEGLRVPAESPARRPEQVEMTPDGRLAALALRGAGRARVLRTEDGRTVSEVEHPEVHSVALSPDGTRLATGTWRGAGVHLWDTATGRLLTEVSTGASYFSHVDFSFDGRWLVVCDAERLRVCQGDRLEVAGKIEGPSHFETIACHPRAPLVAASDPQGRVFLLTLPDLRAVEVLESGSGVNVTWLAFDRAGERLAASSTSKGSVCVWDLRLLAEERRRRGLGN